jgi:hypothetical protein
LLLCLSYKSAKSLLEVDVSLVEVILLSERLPFLGLYKLIEVEKLSEKISLGLFFKE